MKHGVAVIASNIHSQFSGTRNSARKRSDIDAAWLLEELTNFVRQPKDNAIRVKTLFNFNRVEQR